ncbi:hypothetical protein VN97_g4033 [Penicillium thymicola]|uniref:Uncharacterized protein n=1 Tax=Penicillium thymicola TaxID=293382 RepID=A0AAI9X9V8_PENTH|nr:hypothetical protein VN97_g4033 [Penicillium thymicola]
MSLKGPIGPKLRPSIGVYRRLPVQHYEGRLLRKSYSQHLSGHKRFLFRVIFKYKNGFVERLRGQGVDGILPIRVIDCNHRNARISEYEEVSVLTLLCSVISKNQGN